MSTFDRMLVGLDERVLYNGHLNPLIGRRRNIQGGLKGLAQKIHEKIEKHGSLTVQGRHAYVDGNRISVFSEYPDVKYSINQYRMFLDQTGDESKTWLEWIWWTQSEEARLEAEKREIEAAEREKQRIAEENARIEAENRRIEEEHRIRQQQQIEEEKRRMEAEQEALKIQKEQEEAKQRQQEAEEKAKQEQVHRELKEEQLLVDLFSKLGLKQKGKFCVAFMGETKAGKSSMINSFRGKLPSDEGAALVDITEATQETQNYVVDIGSNKLHLYDLPGSNTPRHKASDFFIEKAISGFDCVIMFLGETITTQEASFALEAIKYKKLLIFVKSFMDEVLMDLVEREEIDNTLSNQEQANLAVEKYKEKWTQKLDDVNRHLSFKAQEKIDLKSIPMFCVSCSSMYFHITKHSMDVDDPYSNISFEDEKLVQFILSNAQKHHEYEENFRINRLKFPANRLTYFNFNMSDLEEVQKVDTTSRNIVKCYNFKPLNFKLAIKFLQIPKVVLAKGDSEQEMSNKLTKHYTEILLMHRLSNSPNIVEFYGACLYKKELLICMELMDFSLEKLYHIVHQQTELSSFPENILGRVAVSIINALMACKINNIMHRDIKPKNVLLNFTGSIKLCDFGEARILEDSLGSTSVGTIAYTPPEQVLSTDISNFAKYDVRRDVWSLGISLAEVAYGKFPIRWLDGSNNENATLQMVIHSVKNVDSAELVSRCLENYSEEIKVFVGSCLKNEEDRPYLSQLKQMPFYQKNILESNEVKDFLANYQQVLKN